MISSADPNSVTFKDVFAQFAKMSQSERQELQATMAAGLAVQQTKPSYPEVTLHPVPTSGTATVSQPANASLLHGILTKVCLILMKNMKNIQMFYFRIKLNRIQTNQQPSVQR